MEYFIINKNLKIPTLGFNFNSKKLNELNFYKNYNILSTDKLFIYLDFKNKLNNINFNQKKNLYIAPLIKNLNQIKNINFNLQFIIIEEFNKDIINYCNKNNIYPILFFNYNQFISNKQNHFTNNTFLNKEVIIKYLIEKGIIIISNDKLDIKFYIFLGDLIDN
jgi:hypothetical protein